MPIPINMPISGTINEYLKSDTDRILRRSDYHYYESTNLISKLKPNIVDECSGKDSMR